MNGCVHCDTRQRHYRLATSEKPGEIGRTFHSMCRELLVDLLLGVAKDGSEHSLCGKVWSQQWTRLRRSMQHGTDRKRVLKYRSDCLGKRAGGMQKGSVALHCGGQELQDGFSIFLMNSLIVVIDDVRHTVCDGLYSKCTPHLSVLYTTKKKKKEEEKDPKCTTAHLSVFQFEHCVTWNEEAHGEWNSTVTKPYFHRARELWTDWIYGVSSQLTDTKLQTKW